MLLSEDAYLKDLSGNKSVVENIEKKMNMADIKGTTLEGTSLRKGLETTYDILTTVPIFLA